MSVTDDVERSRVPEPPEGARSAQTPDAVVARSAQEPDAAETPVVPADVEPGPEPGPAQEADGSSEPETGEVLDQGEPEAGWLPDGEPQTDGVPDRESDADWVPEQESPADWPPEAAPEPAADWVSQEELEPDWPEDLAAADGAQPESHAQDAPGADAPPAVPGPRTPRQRLKLSMRPTLSRSHLMAGVLCALLGFALVVQVRASGQAELSTLRQDDLVRLLDEVTNRAEQLDAEVNRLQSSRDELASGTGQAQAALEVAQQRATSEGILSGRLPAQGPGVVVTIRAAGSELRAQHMFNMLEELRNAGAEVVQVNDVRLVASSSFVDVAGGIEADGTLLTLPYRWTVIGDPATLDRALEIPGGALPTVRNAGGTATTEQESLVTIDATVELTDPEFARPAND